MPDRLEEVLRAAAALGFLGPGVPAHRAHSLAFAEAWGRQRTAPPRSLCDLGSGGGVPGLVLALHWPQAQVTLLDSGVRRCAHLREAVAALGLEGRVDVVEGRAEELARSPALAGAFELVTARAFGPPSVTAECAVRLLAPEGLLLVSEPPDDTSRWPAPGLALLGLGQAERSATAPRIATIPRDAPCPDRYPRRVGVPAKQPLF